MALKSPNASLGYEVSYTLFFNGYGLLTSESQHICTNLRKLVWTLDMPGNHIFNNMFSHLQKKVVYLFKNDFMAFPKFLSKNSQYT